MRFGSAPLITSLLVFAPVLLAGCPSSGPAPCTSNADCRTREACIDGHCARVAVDAGMDAGPPDAFVAPDAFMPDTGPPPGAGCSADLRDVLDDTGAVLRTCGMDEGCAAGRCVPACDAAAASHGSIGCEFLSMTPPAYPPALPPCHAVFLANTWARAVRVTVERGGTTYDVSAFGRLVDNATDPSTWLPIPPSGIPVDGVGVLFLSSDPASVMPETGTSLACPIAPAIDAATVIDGTGGGDAWSIGTDAPVSAYDILPFGGAPSFFPSASLLLPTPALGDQYVVIATRLGTATDPGPQWLAVIASEDGTTVSVRPNVDLPAGGTVPHVAPGTVGTVMLDAGRVAQWELASTATIDTSGTIVTADHPVAVVAGNRFFRLQPTPGPGGEATHQQILPVDAMGHHYVAAPYETRRADLMPETISYRIVGAVDGTTLSFDPPIMGAPATLMRGRVADFSSANPFVVSSQDAMHPFGLAQVMPTANLVGGTRPGAHDSMYGPNLGDEEFVVMFPPDQFLSRYVFFTDPTYWTTNLAIVRYRDSTGAFQPVTVDCVGEVGGWYPVGHAHEYEVTTVDLVRGGVGVGSCTNGHHVASSTAPFGITVWGTDAYASYAYPAGGNVQQLSMLPPLI